MTLCGAAQVAAAHWSPTSVEYHVIRVSRFLQELFKYRHNIYTIIFKFQYVL